MPKDNFRPDWDTLGLYLVNIMLHYVAISCQLFHTKVFGCGLGCPKNEKLQIFFIQPEQLCIRM